MKNIVKIFFGVLVLVLFTSCDKDQETTKLSNDIDTGIGFVQAKQVSKVDPVIENSTIKIILGRSKTESAETVAITVTEDSPFAGLSIPQSVTFEQGKAMAELIILVDPSAMAVGKTYKFSLTVQPSVESLSLNKTINVETSLALKWEDVGEGIFETEFFEDSWPASIQKAVGTNTYRIFDAYVEGYHLMFTVNTDNTITFSRQESGYKHSVYGMVYITPSNGITSTYDGINSYIFKAAFIVPTDTGWGSFGDVTEKFTLN